MNPKVVSSVMAALLALLGCGVADVQAQAPPRYGAFVIDNPTPVPISYQIRWGKAGNWKSFTLPPGCLDRHWHLLDAGGLAPAPEIRFHGVGNGWLTHPLHFTATNVPANGKPYRFAYSPNGTCLDLYPR